MSSSFIIVALFLIMKRAKFAFPLDIKAANKNVKQKDK
jgi:hypothetical protein